MVSIELTLHIVTLNTKTHLSQCFMRGFSVADIQ